jgi:hypothetical protein
MIVENQFGIEFGGFLTTYWDKKRGAMEISLYTPNPYWSRLWMSVLGERKRIPN